MRPIRYLSTAVLSNLYRIFRPIAIIFLLIDVMLDRGILWLFFYRTNLSGFSFLSGSQRFVRSFLTRRYFLSERNRIFAQMKTHRVKESSPSSSFSLFHTILCLPDVVSDTRAKTVARSINAQGFVDCSAANNEGIKSVFDVAVSIAATAGVSIFFNSRSIR